MSIVDQLPALGNWLAGDDVGTSSRTMVAIALGATEGDFDAPHDPSDFGRCYRLVKAVPAIRESFLTISMRVPAFLRILHNWDELCTIYVRDLNSGKSSELYQRIKELRGGI